MKSQVNMNHLNEQNLYRQKGKERIGYKEEGESSKQGAEKNKKSSCNHYGKIGHTSNKYWSDSIESATIEINLVIGKMT